MGRTRRMLVLALLAPGLARAQDGFDAHGLYFAPLDGDTRDLVTVQRPGRMLLGDWYMAGVLEVAEDAPRLGTLPEIEGQVVMNATAGFVVNERARLDVAAPIFFATTGPQTPEDATIGDVRVSSQLVLLQPGFTERGGGFGLGAVPWVTLPSGEEELGLGQEGVTGGMLVNATYEWARVTVTGEAGLGFQPEDEFAGRDVVEAGVGMAYQLFERTSVGLEGRSYARLVDDWQDAGVPAELLVHVRQSSERGPHVLGGAALGVTEGVGVPDWRIFVGGGFGRRQDPDPDGDLLVGAMDLCPDAPETVNSYEDLDGCPDTLATLAVVPMSPGGDVLLDAAVVVSNEDQSFARAQGPAVFPGLMPGETWAAASTYACWVGEERDLVLHEGENVIGVPMARTLTANLRFVVADERGVPIEEAVVRWVDDGPNCSPIDLLELPVGLGTAYIGAGVHTIAVTAPGFASRTLTLDVPVGFDQNVEITLGAPEVGIIDDALVTQDRVHFEFDRAEVLPYSFPILDRVAELITSQPELGVVEIAGHADERGPDAYNDALSLRRALAVRDYLVAAGVPSERMYVRGYGEDRPMAEGSNETAWALNRRVHFAVGFEDVPVFVPEEEDVPVVVPRRPES